MEDINIYEKIVDDVFLLGYNTILRFTVKLGSKDKDNKKVGYHTEFAYTTSKYIVNSLGVTVKRNFSYYLSIENISKSPNGDKEFIMIKINDMAHIRERLNKVLKWFNNKNKLYSIKDNKLVLINDCKPIDITGFFNNKVIRIKPTVCDNGIKQEIGVRMFLNKPTNFVDIPLDNFVGFVTIMNEFNMYQSALLLLNYLQRPELGFNRVDFDTSINNLKNKPMHEYKTKEEHDEDLEPSNYGGNRKINTKRKPNNPFADIDDF